MGWVESPPNFCTASETARDVATQYSEAKVGKLEDHKFVKFAMGNDHVCILSQNTEDKGFCHMMRFSLTGDCNLLCMFAEVMFLPEAGKNEWHGVTFPIATILI